LQVGLFRRDGGKTTRRPDKENTPRRTERYTKAVGLTTRLPAKENTTGRTAIPTKATG